MNALVCRCSGLRDRTVGVAALLFADFSSVTTQVDNRASSESGSTLSRSDELDPGTSHTGPTAKFCGK